MTLPGISRTSRYADEDRPTPAAVAAAADDADDRDGWDADRSTTVELGPVDVRDATWPPEVDSEEATASARVR